MKERLCTLDRMVTSTVRRSRTKQRPLDMFFGTAKADSLGWPGDRVTRWLLKRVDCSSIALSCLFNNYPDSTFFLMHACMLMPFFAFLRNVMFFVSQSRFRSRIPRSATLGTSQPHPNASCDTVSHENCGTSEMAVSGGALDTQVRSFQEEGWCQGWFAVELITFCAWTWPHEEMPSLCRCFKREPPKNGFKDS